MMGPREKIMMAYRVQKKLLEDLEQLFQESEINEGMLSQVRLNELHETIHATSWQIAEKLVETCNTSERYARERGKTIAIWDSS